MKHHSKALCALSLFLLVAPLAAQVASPSTPGDSEDAPFQARRGTEIAHRGMTIQNLDSGAFFTDLQAAIDAATAGDTLEVIAATLDVGQVQVTKNLTLQGATATGDETIRMTTNTGNSGDDRAWFLVDTGVDLQVRNLSFDGNGFRVHQGFRHKGTGSFDNCHFEDIQFNASGPDYAGTGIVVFGGRVDIHDSSFQTMGRIGAVAFGAVANGSRFERNTYVGKGTGDWLDYGFEANAGATITLVDNHISNCLGVASVDGSNSAALLITTFSGAGTAATVTRNTLVDSTSGMVVGITGGDTSAVDAAFNRIVDNTRGITTFSTAVTAENNWWGCNGGPGATGCDTAEGTGNPDFDPWLELGLSADPTVIATDGTSNLTATVNTNSDDIDVSATNHIPNGTAITFAGDSLGGASPSSTSTTGGEANATYTAGGSPGTGNPSVTLDHATVTTEVQILPAASPNLLIPERVATVDGSPVSVPVILTKNGLDITAVAFSVDFDQTCLSLDLEDANLDGVPDAIEFLVPIGFDRTVIVDLGDMDGEIDIFIFDLPPDDLLPDGDLVTITFDPLCSPMSGETEIVPVIFSADPSPSFGNTAGQDVPGTSVGGSVEIFSGLRGDCNGDGFVSAGDLSACGLELFDGDGDFWLDVSGGTFAGNPIGCDANADTVVDAGDVSCKGLLIFGLTCSVEKPVTLPASEQPRLVIPNGIEGQPDNTLVVPVFLEPKTQSVTSVVFSIDYDPTALAFDPSNPNAVTFYGAGNNPSFTFQAEDSDGEIDIIIGNLSAEPIALAEGLLVEIQFDILVPDPTVSDVVAFSSAPKPSFGDTMGQGLPGQADVGLFVDGFESGDTSAWSLTIP